MHHENSTGGSVKRHHLGDWIFYVLFVGALGVLLTMIVLTMMGCSTTFKDKYPFPDYRDVVTEEKP